MLLVVKEIVIGSFKEHENTEKKLN